MPRFFLYSVKILYLLGTALLLSSCGDKTFITGYPVPESEIASPVSSISTDQELLLEEAESEQLLTEEIEALRHTGTWRHENGSSVPVQKAAPPCEFPIVINKQVQAYLDLFQNRQKKQFAVWLSRSGKYIPMFRKELRDAGLPEDLAYLAMIESGFNQRAFSRAKAVGLWQFIKDTGKEYNLQIDNYVDERRHAEKSTKAAVAFLSDLYADFGDWHLAVAAYNAGAGKIRRGMNRYKSNDFWSLAQHDYLQMETKRYVPKLIAAILIANNPKKYGFTNIAYDSPLEYETMRVGPGLSLEAVALICNANDKDIKRLNQELTTGKTPLNKSSYDVQIPLGSKKLAESNLPRLHSVVSTGYKTHIIEKSDTLSKICKLYNINNTTLLKVNNLHSNRLIAGNHLRIPYNAIHYRLMAEGKQDSLMANDLVLHKIRHGETISKIAQKYNVPVDLIVSWNGLKSRHNIRAGQQLALYIEDSDNTQYQKQKTTNSIAVSDPNSDSSLLVLGEQKKFKLTKRPLATSQISWYKVRQGDSLWAIARKFNLSPTQLKSWNNLKSNRIHPGIKLKIGNV